MQCVWKDVENDFTYVFIIRVMLSPFNRILPKIQNLKVRKKDTKNKIDRKKANQGN